MNSPDSAFSVTGAYFSHPGAIRNQSEDAIYFGKLHVGENMEAALEAQYDGKDPWMIVLADGLSGQKAGAEASRECISSLLTCQELTPFRVQAALREINRNLHARGQNDPQLCGLGATVVGLACGPDGIFAFNVGDARIYRQQDQFLNLISYDDCLTQTLEANDSRGEGLMRTPTSHILTQSLGGTLELREITPHFFPLAVRTPTTYLLCTDGLTDALTLDQMEEVLRQPRPAKEQVEELFRRAMLKGAHDNITLALAQVTPI
jgi:serine/threonine protein phosphatase PrpC